MVDSVVERVMIDRQEDWKSDIRFVFCYALCRIVAVRCTVRVIEKYQSEAENTMVALILSTSLLPDRNAVDIES